MAPASIRIRLTTWYGTLLMVTIAGLGIAIYILMAQSLLKRVDAMLDFEFEEAAERLTAGQPAEGLTSAPAAFHESYLLRILASDGRILAQSPSLHGKAIPVPRVESGDPPTSHLSTRLGALGPCRVVTGNIGSDAGHRIVQIATPLDSYEGELKELRVVLWTILPAGLVVATIGGYWLAGRVLAPVGRMTEAARRISAANLGERIEVATPGDELGRLAITLNAMLDRIDRAFVATRRFTADAAHELKTPLASIRAEAEVSLLSRRSPDDYEETLRSIVEETERLSRLTDRLLLLSCEDSGARLPRQLIWLDETVQAAIHHAAEAASHARISLRVETLTCVEVEGDHDMLRQVFDNLIDNALKYTPAGGVVTVRGRCDNEHAIVEVCDTGIGIPEVALSRVFDRFYRVDASRSRRTGGTGLGLSIAKAVVERHGGTAEATSILGQGSTFRILLPKFRSNDK
ncbi:ATP-binding protein [Singulisphaera sp. Ch08]|uniref:histidine kinase n=1 Tax=Singulisphaera sp. Ch08 TaxID=3120278 RepID=A0AAU7CHZ6_9BACT